MADPKHTTVKMKVAVWLTPIVLFETPSTNYVTGLTVGGNGSQSRWILTAVT